MSVEREMSLAEWCAKLPSLHLVNQELSTLNTQLAALAEQNEKFRTTLENTIVASHLDRTATIAVWRVKEALQLPDLATPVLNRIRAEGIGVFNSGDDPKAALNKLQCYSEGVGGFFAHCQLQEQAAEISRLKAVIAKCHSALVQCKQWKEGANTLTCHNHESVEEALCMIKEIERV